MSDALRKGLDARETSHPVLVSLLREVLRVYPPVASALAWMTEPDQADCWDDGEYHLARLFRARTPHGLTIPSLAHAFVVNCADYIKEQAYFVRHGNYRGDSNDAFVETLYQNDHEMSAYMDGLLASTFTWRNHYAIFRFYRDAFLPGACGEAAGDPRGDELVGPEGIEVGPGHGLYFVLGLTAAGRSARAVGIDVSPTSIALTRDLAHAHGIPDDRFQLIEHNVKNPLPFETGRFAYAVSGEVLEHIDNPEFLLGELRRVTRRGGKAFVTTAINAAARDHIFLFRSEQEIIDMLGRAGWTVEQKILLPVPLPEFLRQAGAGSENCAYIVS